jgi:serine/threonine protein kinase
MADIEGEVKYPTGFSMKDVVAWGSTGLVVHDEASQTVIKAPFWDDGGPRVIREREIYERLTQRGGHPRILRYYGTFEDGIRLEYVPNGSIRMFYHAQEQSGISFEHRLRWATQIAEALGFLHSAGIIHGDLTCHDIFLDEGLNAKVAGFGGSSLDGSELLICIAPSHEYPGPVLSTQGDIFALGSVLYEIVTGSPPYVGLSDTEIEDRYKKGNFAETASLGEMGVIIRKCWLGVWRSRVACSGPKTRYIMPTIASQVQDRSNTMQFGLDLDQHQQSVPEVASALCK